MQGPTNETVGESFSEDLLQTARDKTLKVILNSVEFLKPGMTESEAKIIIQNEQEKLGASRHWHPPQIRFGPNSTRPFGKPGIEGVALKQDDIFFLDIGPVFDDHEGDVGRTFYLGADPEMKKCCSDVELIWNEVRNHWRDKNVSGPELYEFAKERAKEKGWVLALEKANGHRIADFPHAAKIRGSIEGFEQVPAPNRWILEIQIRHPEREFGAFYEDLLN